MNGFFTEESPIKYSLFANSLIIGFPVPVSNSYLNLTLKVCGVTIYDCVIPSRVSTP